MTNRLTLNELIRAEESLAKRQSTAAVAEVEPLPLAADSGASGTRTTCAGPFETGMIRPRKERY